MSKIYYIDGIDVTDYVSTFFAVNEQRSLVGEDIVRIGNFDVSLWNGDFRFSPHYPASIFYGRSLYESFLYIIDDGIEIFRGRIKTISLTQNNATLTIASYFDETLDKNLVYIANNINPADAFKEIMILNNLEDYIDEFSYLYSKSLLDDYGLIIDAFFFIDSNTSVVSGLQQLGEICGADVYFSKGKIHFLCWEEQKTGTTTLKISASQIEGFQIFTDSENIRNQYSFTMTITPDPNAGVEYNIYDSVFGKDSRRLYGERSYQNFNLSKGNNFSTENIIAMSDIGRNKIQRGKDPKKYITFTVIASLFPYPWTLQTVFTMNSDNDNYVGEGLDVDVYQVVSLNFNDNKTQITGVKIN
jgi:hypothetical protein